ncbi:MAG TPA: EcoRII N-terminal effector-binding domain-containing protein [Verrucomicrobiota bacterium]|nr:EcoRII N-terminal effector-binding domain-containing protein [Verrucomicrobiota bacterium]
MATNAIEKTLSKNDTGETGGHQAGILVPKDPEILGFFPQLEAKIKNPRVPLDLLDDTGREWTFMFIYYNNKFFDGTRNEYRITGMTAFLREFNLKAGDKVILRRESPRILRITFKRAGEQQGVLKLSSTWKVIDAEF